LGQHFAFSILESQQGIERRAELLRMDLADQPLIFFAVEFEDVDVLAAGNASVNGDRDGDRVGGIRSIVRFHLQELRPNADLKSSRIREIIADSGPDFGRPERGVRTNLFGERFYFTQIASNQSDFNRLTALPPQGEDGIEARNGAGVEAILE